MMIFPLKQILEMRDGTWLSIFLINMLNEKHEKRFVSLSGTELFLGRAKYGSVFIKAEKLN